MLQKIRTILAVAFFACITLLFLDFTGTLHTYLGWMAKVQFLPAVLALNVVVVALLILLTLIFGRIYCSIICPLGVFQDAIAHVGKHGKRHPYKYSGEKKWLRYGVLAIFVVAIVAGIGSLVALLAPYSAYGRMAQNIFQPVYLWGNNLLAVGAEHLDSYAFYHRDVWMRSLPTFVVALVTMVAIGWMAWKNGRTYCNTICPVGTVLSFFSRFAWLKVYIDSDKCVHCMECGYNCKAACIDSKNMKIDYSRCVACGDCLQVCEHSALRYGHPTKETLQKCRDWVAARDEKVRQRKVESEKAQAKQMASGEPSADVLSRRGFLLTAAIAATAAAKAQTAKTVDGGLAKIADKVAPQRSTPLTPPGSLSAANMARHCTACQLCVAECPNDVLRPSTDPLTFMQPTMSYERGYCRPECTRCSEVCPTGAINEITRADKSSTQIGHAVWIKKNCIVVTDGVECGNCARHCPVGAIDMVELTVGDSIVEVPSVNASRCIGCGACENLCPARPLSAIYVEGHEVHKTK